MELLPDGTTPRPPLFRQALGLGLRDSTSIPPATADPAAAPDPAASADPAAASIPAATAFPAAAPIPAAVPIPAAAPVPAGCATLPGLATLFEPQHDDHMADEIDDLVMLLDGVDEWFSTESAVLVEGTAADLAVDVWEGTLEQDPQPVTAPISSERATVPGLATLFEPQHDDHMDDEIDDLVMLLDGVDEWFSTESAVLVEGTVADPAVDVWEGTLEQDPQPVTAPISSERATVPGLASLFEPQHDDHMDDEIDYAV